MAKSCMVVTLVYVFLIYLVILLDMDISIHRFFYERKKGQLGACG